MLAVTLAVACLLAFVAVNINEVSTETTVSYTSSTTTNYSTTLPPNPELHSTIELPSHEDSKNTTPSTVKLGSTPLNSVTITDTTNYDTHDSTNTQRTVPTNEDNQEKEKTTIEPSKQEKKHEAETNTPLKKIDECKSPSEDAILARILIGGENGIYWANEKDKGLPVLVNISELNAYSVDYHYKKKYMFFSIFNQSIFRLRIDYIHPDGDNRRVVDTTGAGDVQVAVDWVNDHLYWMSSALKVIQRTDLNGNNSQVVFDNQSAVFDYPSNLEVDPYQRLLFFINTQRVFQMDLNNQGTNAVEFDQKSLGDILYLTLQRHEQRLYFSGRDYNNLAFVGSSQYNGAGVKFHPADIEWDVILSIGVYRDKLFVAHCTENRSDAVYVIQTTNSSSKFGVKEIFPPLSYQHVKDYGIWALRVFHANVQSPIDHRTCLEADN